MAVNEISGVINKHNSSQTIQSSGSSCELNIKNGDGTNSAVQIMANATEGGNIRLEKGLAHAELDTSAMNSSGTGSVRLYLNDGTSSEVTKSFLFKQDGSFTDGNGVNTKNFQNFVYNNVASFTEDISGTNTRFLRKDELKMLIINYQGESKTHAAGDVLFTLNTGYRPAYLFYVPFVVGNTGYGLLAVQTSGAVTVSTVANGSTAGRIYAHFVVFYGTNKS